MQRFKSSSFVKALYELGIETYSIDLFFEESKKWIDLLEENRKILNYFSDYLVPFEEKEELVKKITKNKILRNFFFVLIEEKNIRFLETILLGFIKRVNDEKNIEEGIVYTIDKLTKKQIEDIQKGISKSIKKDVFLVNKIDKEIIGGIKVIIKDKVWDYTIETQIKELSQKIVNKG